MLSVPDKIRPGMSSTVNIITETLEDVLSIPIQSLTSRPENYADQSNKKTNEKKWKRKDEDEERSFKKIEPIDVVFILEDKFDDQIAPPNKKFAIVRPIDVGESSENHYSVRSGVGIGEMIVIGGYRILSKELFHGTLVSVNDNSSSGDE